MVDLHTHSTASDGEKSPSELVLSAKEAGLSVLALTDHDTVGGLEEAASCAKKAGIIFVPGIEINVQWPTGEFHLLGLGLKEISASMKALIKSLKKNRIDRNKKILAALQNNGFDFCGHHEKNIGRQQNSQRKKNITEDLTDERSGDPVFHFSSPLFSRCQGEERGRITGMPSRQG